MIDSSTTAQAWSVRYEQLRTSWLDQEIGWGQALFIRQGMAAWMKAWPAETSPVPRSEGYTPASTPSPAIALTGGLPRQLTHELANLILHRQQEIVA